MLTSVVSSAYSIALNLSLTICKSFIYSMNNNGPNIDPWGTPVEIGNVFDISSSSFTNCCLSVR